MQDKKIKGAVSTTLIIALGLSASVMAIGGAPLALNVPASAAENSPDQSYYRDFQTKLTETSYALSGTLYQNGQPRSLLRLEAISPVELQLSGHIEPIQGAFKLVYQDAEGNLRLLAESQALAGETLALDTVFQAEGKGEIYFEAASAICAFDLTFTTAEGVSYYLTTENTIGMAY